ncbi:MAG: hypothetical protein ACI9UT_000441 [Flavobacteriales bacterium]
MGKKTGQKLRLKAFFTPFSKVVASTVTTSLVTTDKGTPRELILEKGHQ